MSRASLLTEPTNIAAHLVAMAAREPHTPAVIAPAGRDRAGRMRYVHHTYRQLDLDSDVIALGLGAFGIERGTRAILLVRPGLDFFSLVFALFKAGVVPVVIDPGIGMRSIARCCREAAPGLSSEFPRPSGPRDSRLGAGNSPSIHSGRIGPPISARSRCQDARRPARRGESAPGTAARFGAAGHPWLGRRDGRHSFHQRQHGPAQGSRLFQLDLFVAGEGLPRHLPD